VRPYTLTADQFRSLASGYGDEDALAVLAASQLSRRRLAVRAIMSAADQARSADVAPLLDAFRLFTRAEAARPEAARAVLAHPHFDVWAVQCLRALTADGHDLSTAVAHFGVLAVAAAARAGISFVAVVAGRGGSLVLPTLGAVRDVGVAPVRIHGDERGLTFEAETRTVVVPAPYLRENPYWAPVREAVAAAPGLSHVVAIEDLDPYRDCYQWRPMDRLSGAEADRMRRLYHEAWGLLVRDHAVHAAGIRATLRSLVPLASARPDRTVSATSTRAFGSLGVSLPEEPATLGLLLVHEFQHMKLSALLDLVDLCRTGGEARYFAPWRPDPRPAAALLQGVYAHVGVVDFWRQRRLVETGVAARIAEFEFALWRGYTAEATESLLDAEELTELGVRFVSHLAKTLAGWRGEPVSPDLEAAAADVSLAGVVQWRLAHWRPSQNELRLLLDALRAAAPCPPLGEALRHPADSNDPPAIASLIRSHVVGGRSLPRGADGAYLAGRYDEAADAYAALIERGEPGGWVGLALVLGRLGRPGAGALVRRPDLVVRLYADGPKRLDPAALAAWIEPALPPV